ncbi:hypothetical protein AKJ43_01670 [candidate division MSBL1 archaeon SCGC-AAA261D19]|uniref:Uncharacterized protein n=1 Tax=candidate division MSBL1 archaeon SCGC-AAA261D19 TaxID=1698273 RepID=A0A133V7S5_9EURY|nr:hypothetical protein AKJ43_01670 [candidate division MSBL1 archaeon SCGC-AAA261D19]
MHEERLEALFWLLVVCSWAFGLITSYWFGSNEFFLEMSKAVRVISPNQMNEWWQPLIYFTLTTVAVFMLSQLFFGVGAVIFLFARGMYDGLLIAQLGSILGGWNFADFPVEQVWMVLIFILILSVNLPLCLWSGKLGVQRASYMLYRLRNTPVQPNFGAEPLSKFPLILAISIIIGVLGALLLSYA